MTFIPLAPRRSVASAPVAAGRCGPRPRRNVRTCQRVHNGTWVLPVSAGAPHHLCARGCLRGGLRPRGRRASAVVDGVSIAICRADTRPPPPTCGADAAPSLACWWHRPLQLRHRQQRGRVRARRRHVLQHHGHGRVLMRECCCYSCGCCSIFILVGPLTHTVIHTHGCAYLHCRRRTISSCYGTRR